jgi:dipeptidyl aminopeptidase/acylaminoacyl peptidase
MRRLVFAFVLLSVSLGHAAEPPKQPTRTERGALVLENIPDIPAEFTANLQRYQNARSVSFEGWQNDGGALITTRLGETAQVHRVKAPLGMRQQLTFGNEPIAGALPRPKQDSFVFSRDNGGDEFFQLYYQPETQSQPLRLTDGKSRNTSPHWNETGSALAFGSTARNGKDVDIYLLNQFDGTQKPELLLPREGSWRVVDFRGDDLLLMREVSASHSELHRLRLGSSTSEKIAGGEGVFIADAAFGKGNDIYLVSDENNEFRTLRLIHNGKEKALSSGADVVELAVSAGLTGKHVAFVENREGYSQLYADGKAVATPKGLISGLHWRGKALGFALEQATAPADLYVLNGLLQRWTVSETGNIAGLVAPELIAWNSFDGKKIPGFYYRAPQAGKRPVIINIHGGPEAQALPNFAPIYQYYLQALGAAVILPNVRGSSGYGKSYLALDNGYRREDSVKDIGALLDWIAEQPELDKDRVIVMGGSYGGYMTLASLVKYSQRVKAGIDTVGISHFVTFLNNTQAYRRDLRRVEYGDERIPEMRTFMEAIAPLNNASQITVPLFVVQGANDPRVPQSEAEQMVAKVRAQNVPVWYLLAKDEGHGFKKKGNRDFYQLSVAWFIQAYL